MKLSDLAVDRAETSFPPYEGADGQVKITFRPKLLTPESTDRLNQSAMGNDLPMLEWLAGTPEKDDGDGGTIEAVEGALVSWDVEDDDGNVLPITVETLRTLPNRFLVRLVYAMQIGSAPGEAKSGA